MLLFFVGLFISTHACAQTYSAEETSFLEVINAFRSELNLRPLKIDARLSEAAEGHAEWMSHRHLLTHAGPRLGWGSGTRMYAAGVQKGTLVGENIARGSFDAKSTFIQWFFSSAHLDGMVTPEYTHIGIARRGCDQNSDERDCFWVTDFAQLELPSAVNESLESAEFLQSSFSYSDETLINAAEKIVGKLDADEKQNFENPTLED